jgi:hypothetical protein
LTALNWLAGAKNPLHLNGSNIHPWLGIWKLSLMFRHEPNMKGSTTTVYREHRFRFKAGPLSLRKQPPVCSASREVFEHPCDRVAIFAPKNGCSSIGCHKLPIQFLVAMEYK